MSPPFRRSLNFAVFTFLLAALLASRALGAAVPGQSVTQLPDGRWLLLGGEGSSAPALTIAGERGETLEEKVMGVPRSRHTATVLPDGRVLVFGGFDKTGAFVRGAQIFDVSTLTFEALPDPGLSARAGHTTTVLMDGRVLFLGGVSPSGQPVPEVELWDPKTGRAERIGERLELPRWGHSATVLLSGGILISGGHDRAGLAFKTPELFLPGELRFAPLEEAAAASRARVPAGAAPEVAAIFPWHGADEVALDTRIAVRFSRPLRAGSLSPDTVTLLGPGGATKARVTSAEGGMLLFVTPVAQLFPGTEYTLFINGAVDLEENPLPFVASGFRTRSLTGRGDEETEPSTGRDRDGSARSKSDSKEGPEVVAAGAADTAGTEVWIPGPAQMRGDWRVHRPPSPLQALPAFAAKPGVTALAGQVLLLNGEAAEGVTLRVGERETRSDGTGRFLLEDVPSGTRTLLIDGGTANRPGRTYGLFEARVMIVPGRTTALPYTVWLPRIDTQNAVKFPSPTTQEVVVTSPHIRGLELHIPAGAVLRDRAGNVVTEVSITPIPVDRSPFPLPTGDVPVYFTIQPGGVHLQSLDPNLPQGARLIYPNYTGAAPGTVLDFWNYDPVDKGWYVYGQGKVNSAGRQVVPDAGVAIYELTGAMVSLPNNGPPDGPPPGGCGQGGDPVDCYTGLFLHTRTDLSLPGTLPIGVTRTYRPRDMASRAFGIGTNHAYDIFTVGDTWPYTYQELILPDGGRVRFERISPGTSFSDAVYEHTSSPSEYQGAVISYFGGQWRLRMKNGVEMYFADCEGCTSARAAALLSYRDRWGNRLTIDRDTSRNVTRVTSPDGRFIEFTYDTSNRITEARDNTGRVVTYQYDASGRLWKVTNPEGGVEEYGYDTSNRMATVKKPNGTLMVTNVYDAKGRVTQQTLSDGGVYKFAYTLDGSGRVTQTDVTDPRGNVRRIVFNTRGYVVSETLALGKPEQQTTAYELDPATNLKTATTDALGRRTELTYDARGNATSLTRLAGTPDAVTMAFTYDPAYNQLTSITDALGNVLELRYDSLGQLTEVEDPLGNIARFTYTATGKMATATDPNGKLTQLAYEGGDVAAITDPLGRTVSMYTDAAGRILALTDTVGNRYRYEYDRLDRVTKITDPLGAETTYVYDANGNLTQVTDARGGVTRFDHDAKERLKSVTDPLLKTESYEYDGMNNLTRVTDRNGKIATFTYDALDRLKTAELGRATLLAAPDATVTHTWDAGNRLTQIVDTQDGSITRGYDALDRLVSETSLRGSVGYAYDTNGRRTRLTIPGQTDVTYAYDDANRLTGITQGTVQVGFGYDAAGRRTTLNLPNGIVADYTYDDAGQLTGMVYKRGGVTIGDLAYQYDAGGRRVLESGSLARRTLPAAVASATYNAANRLTSWGGTALAYDFNGNLTSDGSRTYSWDSRNRLTAIAGAATGGFGYDAFGRRSFATLSGSTTSFLYDGSNATHELAGASVKASMLRGFELDEIFQRTDAAGPRTFLTDPLGSALALTDDAGAVRTEYRYDLYGATIASGDASGNLVQYTGRENDGTGLYYYRARYYNPSLGRFISEDPIGLQGGANLYAYVDGDPLSYTDPTGEFWNYVIGGAIGGGIDLASQLIQNGGNWRCINLGQLAASTALGALGGGLGGRALTSGLRGLSNTTKGQIGEALSVASNTLKGSTQIAARNTATIPSQTTLVDSTWRSITGRIYYVESKFGTSGLTSAQRRAAQAMGDAYHVERWGYPFFDRAGAAAGSAVGGGAGAASGLGGGDCSCQ
jgi:RHS repeat-associated protein